MIMKFIIVYFVYSKLKPLNSQFFFIIFKMKTVHVIEFMFVFVLFVVLLTFLSSKYEKKTMAEA